MDSATLYTITLITLILLIIGLIFLSTRIHKKLSSSINASKQEIIDKEELKSVQLE